MRKRNRWLPALLALSLVLSLWVSPTARAAESVTGSISAAVRIDYDQTLTELRKRQIQAELFQGDVSLGTVDLTRPGGQSLTGGYTATVTLRDAGGGELTGEWPRYLEFSVDGLPQGAYAVRFSGRGYVPCRESFVLKDYARHVIVGTGDASFSLGDCDGDGRVDGRDREKLSAALGSAGSVDLENYDLNGDGAIDIVDLAYVNRQIDARGGAQLLETNLLAPPVDLDALTAALTERGVAVGSGNPADLFRSGGSAVTFRPNASGEIVLTIPFRQSVELEEMTIVSAAFAPILAGVAEVEDESGQIFRYPFDNTLPAGIHALSVQEGSNVITVDLGKQVAVKKITITVTKTETGSVTVESIQFLKEMVPVDPEAAYSQVTGLTAQAGSERVSLQWNALPNVAGYLVSWWPEAAPGLVQKRTVEINRAEITGLENLTPYQFTVTAVDGAWSGKPSDAVTATPQPAAAPAAPDMAVVTALDGALRLSWKASKGATYYEVYYTSQPNAPVGSYARFGGALTATGTTITGLTNDTTYYVYIIAGNEVGRSGPSRISSGVPKAVDYSRPAGIPTRGVLDWRDFAAVRLADPSNYLRSEYAVFDPAYMADGDFRTHWTARNWYSNEHVVVTFLEPQDLCAAIWVPRLDGTYASDLRAYSVQVWYAGENLNGPGHLVTGGVDRGALGNDADMQTWPAIRGNPAVSKFAAMPFEPQRNVVQISVAAEQRGYNLTTLSELMFLKYDEEHRLADDIGGLFADPLRTALAPGVDRARVDALQARLDGGERDYCMEPDTLADELALARELLDKGRSSGAIVRGVHAINSAGDLNYGQGGSVLQPLGAAAGAGQEITIYASGIPAGEKVELIATQFNAEANTWQASMGTLANGRNVLTVPQIGSQSTPRGGSLYITYSGSAPQGIQLHVRRAVDIPTLDVTAWSAMTAQARTAAVSAYLAELDVYAPAGNPAAANDWRNVTEIATPSVLLSLPAQAVSAALKENRAEQLTNAILAWEQVMEICRTVQGIPGPIQVRQNIRCMQMFSGAFMYAAGSHVGIGYGSCGGMVSGAPVTGAETEGNRLFGWGIAHEIGHNMDKLGKAEITNNIYSLAVQTYDGKANTLPSRLENSGKYAAIFNKTAQSLPGASGDVFVQLGMYWQLHLAYDGGDQPLDFYSKFFTSWKAGTYFAGASSYDDKVARTAAGVTGYDLTDFFTHWGMELSEETRDTLSKLKKEERAIWYLNDQSRRERLAETLRAEGSVSAEAEKTGEQEIQLTFSANAANGGKILGYEIFRNDTPIAFTTAETYTDFIGSGNNRTYRYTVKAYDCLGYSVGSAETEEVRVAYDLLVDSKEYTVSRSGDTVTFKMNKPTAVSGLRLPLTAMTGGALQVTVKDSSGKQTTVCAGTLSAGAEEDRFLAYFHLAGDQQDNDRIGTYQAVSVTVAGIPAGVKDEDIRLISYAGDDIAFLSDSATMGRLAKAYTYDTPKGKETIPADTLVIAGQFQGDPMYNTVRITGSFPASDLKGGEDGPSGMTEEIWPGEVLLFAQEQEDNRYGTISKGIFLFIPEVQEETGTASCGGKIQLPARIRAELWRTVTPDSTEGTRCTAQTLWISCPGGDALPQVVLKGGGQ